MVAEYRLYVLGRKIDKNILSKCSFILLDQTLFYDHALSLPPLNINIGTYYQFFQNHAKKDVRSDLNTILQGYS